MRIQTFASLASSGRLGLLMKVTGLFKPFYRLTYVASAASCGLLGFMGVEPRTLEEIAHALNPDLPPEHRGSLSAWLALGVRLGTLKRQGDRYALKSMLARRLADSASIFFCDADIVASSQDDWLRHPQDD